MRRLGLAALLVCAWPMAAFAASYDDLNAGIQASNSGSWADAVSDFDRALAANDLTQGLQYVAHLDRGEAEANLGRPEPAITDFTASLTLRPGDKGALLGRASVFSGMRKFEEAMGDLDSIIASSPGFTPAYLRRASVEIKLGKPDEAFEDLKAVRSAYPDNAALARAIGIVEWQIGRIPDAEVDFSTAVSKGSNDIYAWFWLALTEARLGKPVPKRSLPDYDTKNWPAALVDHFLGKAGRDAVFSAAQTSGGKESVEGQACEANFYAGEWLLQQKDTVGAKPLIQKAADTCPRDFVEWSPAQTDAKNLP